MLAWDGVNVLAWSDPGATQSRRRTRSSTCEMNQTGARVREPEGQGGEGGSARMAPLLPGDRVLVTGAAGYIGAWVVHFALQEGCRVRGTCRDPADENKLRHLFALPGATDRLEMVAMDLLSEDSSLFEKAVEGCTHVVHVASPLMPQGNVSEDDYLKPAVEGTLKVLRACASPVGANVRYVVVTSSVAAIGFGDGKVFTEADWKDPSQFTPYSKSKTLAEKAAWAFVNEHKPKWEMCTINPGAVLGPALSESAAKGTLSMLYRMLARKMPMCPPLWFMVGDVRDVARAHVLALTKPGTAGHRFILAAEPSVSMKDMSLTVKKQFGEFGYNPPTLTAPYALMWLVSWIDPAVALLLPQMNYRTRYDNAPSKNILGLEYRSLDETIRQGCESLLYHGIVERLGNVPVNWSPPVNSDGNSR